MPLWNKVVAIPCALLTILTHRKHFHYYRGQFMVINKKYYTGIEFMPKPELVVTANPSLTIAGRGLWTFIMHWQLPSIDVDFLVEVMPDTREDIEKAIQSLIECGYLMQHE